jgi:hypothetical protein
MTFELSSANGKGKIPATEKQADQMAYYDSVLAAWASVGLDKTCPLPIWYIEKMTKHFSGEPRGVPLQFLIDIIKKTTAIREAKNPLAKLWWSVSLHYENKVNKILND